VCRNVGSRHTYLTAGDLNRSRAYRINGLPSPPVRWRRGRRLAGWCLTQGGSGDNKPGRGLRSAPYSLRISGSTKRLSLIKVPKIWDRSRLQTQLDHQVMKAAMLTAASKLRASLSYLVAIRRQSLSLQNMRSMRFRSL
jgi:hypothetical protein